MPRPAAWADSMVSMGLADGVSQSLNMLTTLSASDTKTAVRLVGRLSALPQTPEGQVDGVMSVRLGIGVAASEAFGIANSAGLPQPDIAADVPIRGWLYRQHMLVAKEHATGTTNEWTHVDTVQFDLRAARKVDRGVLYFIVEANVVDGTAFNVRLTGLLRALCLT